MQKLSKKIVDFLMRRRPVQGLTLTDFDRLCYELRPADVLLFAGRSRISDIISLITQSPWTHTALYIGRIHDIEDVAHREKVMQFYQGDASEQLILESVMGKGTIIRPLTYYKQDHIRICRPTRIDKKDSQQVINYAIDRLGVHYDIRQIFDLMRFLLPWRLIPRRWRSSLFRYNPGPATKQVCSSLIAEAFESVQFPVLPLIKTIADSKVELYQRYPRLFTPSDFDFSPYFEIIKYPMYNTAEPLYRSLPWNHEGKFSDTEGNIYVPQDFKEP